MAGSVTYGRTAPDDIADQLRTRIMGGELGPGDRLPNERDLAAQLGVARPTLREAIRLLVGEGFLNSRRGNAGGTFVSDLSEPRLAWLHRVRQHPEEIRDVYEHRMALEQHAVSLAARRHSPEDVRNIRSALLAAAHPASRQTFRQADHRFHLAIADAAGSPRIAAAIARIRGEIFVSVDTLSYQDHFDQNVVEHAAIARAVERGDAARAARAMAAHLRSSLADLLHQVEAMDGP